MAPHIFLSHAPQDAPFARQLGVQLQQRGLIVWRALEAVRPDAEPPPDAGAALEAASHVITILSPEATAAPDLLRDWGRALGMRKHVIVVIHETCDIPKLLQPLPRVDFRGRFLLAVEDLVQHLKATGAPMRPLTIEYPPPVVKPDLLPGSLPSERCWREDRIQINYVLPMILPIEELTSRAADFFKVARFELIDTGPHGLRAQRIQMFNLFDPRRAEQTLVIDALEGLLMVRYQMTRTQVYYWLPAHYRVFDRESAALYRVLATGTVEANALESVDVQAERAQALSWLLLAGILLVLIGVVALLLYELFDIALF